MIKDPNKPFWDITNQLCSSWAKLDGNSQPTKLTNPLMVNDGKIDDCWSIWEPITMADRGKDSSSLVKFSQFRIAPQKTKPLYHALVVVDWLLGGVLGSSSTMISSLKFLGHYSSVSGCHQTVLKAWSVNTSVQTFFDINIVKLHYATSMFSKMYRSN